MNDIKCKVLAGDCFSVSKEKAGGHGGTHVFVPYKYNMAKSTDGVNIRDAKKCEEDPRKGEYVVGNGERGSGHYKRAVVLVVSRNFIGTMEQKLPKTTSVM